jgi:hypothetical protein
MGSSKNKLDIYLGPLNDIFVRARVGITFLSLLGLLNHTFVVPPQFSGAKSSSSRLGLIQNPRRKERKVIPTRALTRRRCTDGICHDGFWHGKLLAVQGQMTSTASFPQAS